MQTRGIRIIDDQDFASIDSDILLPSTSMVLQWFSCNKVTYRYILLTHRSHLTYIQFYCQFAHWLLQHADTDCVTKFLLLMNVSKNIFTIQLEITYFENAGTIFQ